jgi:hypothetical protein
MNWRKLFPICWYREKEGYPFNIVIFLADVCIWAIILFVAITKLTINAQH